MLSDIWSTNLINWKFDKCKKKYFDTPQKGLLLPLSFWGRVFWNSSRVQALQQGACLWSNKRQFDIFYGNNFYGNTKRQFDTFYGNNVDGNNIDGHMFGSDGSFLPCATTGLRQSPFAFTQPKAAVSQVHDSQSEILIQDHNNWEGSCNPWNNVGTCQSKSMSPWA